MTTLHTPSSSQIRKKQTPVPFLNIFDLKMVDDHMMGLEYMMYNTGSVDRKDEEELVVGSGS